MPPSTRPDRAPAPEGSCGHSLAGVARKEDNIYIPSYISKQPFYITGLDEDDSLQHQRSRPVPKDDLDDEATKLKGKKTGPARTKWVKGSCENCGAMGHNRKDCLERPRKFGAKLTGKDIQADRLVHQVKLGYEAKRDIYRGYDPKQYQEVIEEYNLLEEARRQLQTNNGGGDANDGEDVYEKDFKYAEETDLSRDKTVKQSLRVREDTAKYLLNLDSDSAKYNPKKRALVDAGAIGDKSSQLFAEETFLRASGEAAEFEKAQRYAWEAQERTGNTALHLQANPTAGEVLRKKEHEERLAKRQKRAELLTSQYGEQPAAPDGLKLPVIESETFVEYDEAGLIKGAPRKAVKSKYPEDIFVNNHTSIWGSWWSNFKWGYACCHSCVKNSYCTGDLGKNVDQETAPSS